MKALGAVWSCWRPMLLGSVFFVCVACGSVISKDLRQTADLSLHFGTVVGNPTAYTGQVVLWAGTILEATNLPEATRLIILHFPRGSRDRPLTHRGTGGRFIVRRRAIWKRLCIVRAGRLLWLAKFATNKSSHLATRRTAILCLSRVNCISGKKAMKCPGCASGLVWGCIIDFSAVDGSRKVSRALVMRRDRPWLPWHAAGHHSPQPHLPAWPPQFRYG